MLLPLSNLRYLSIVHLPRVSDLGPLSKLESLETVALHTLPSWDQSNKRTNVRSLSPLTALPRLRHIELLGVVPEDESLRALAELPSLKTSALHGYPKPKGSTLLGSEPRHR